MLLKSRTISLAADLSIAASKSTFVTTLAGCSSLGGSTNCLRNERRTSSSFSLVMLMAALTSALLMLSPGLCQSNGRSSARGATRPPSSDIQAARARHSANAAERLCLQTWREIRWRS